MANQTMEKQMLGAIPPWECVCMFTGCFLLLQPPLKKDSWAFSVANWLIGYVSDLSYSHACWTMPSTSSPRVVWLMNPAFFLFVLFRFEEPSLPLLLDFQKAATVRGTLCSAFCHLPTQRPLLLALYVAMAWAAEQTINPHSYEYLIFNIFSKHQQRNLLLDKGPYKLTPQREHMRCREAGKWPTWKWSSALVQTPSDRSGWVSWPSRILLQTKHTHIPWLDRT